MKKILFINNYDCLTPYKQHVMPGHHQFGMEFLNEDPDYEVYYYFCKIFSKNSKGYYLKEFFQFLKLYILSFKFDIVYDALGCEQRYFGFLNRFHMFKPYYMLVFHHPPFEKRLKYCKYDHIIFECEYYYKKMCRMFPKQADKMSLCVWGPDLSFYPQIDLNFDEPILISNGRTNRDHNLLVDAATYAKVHTVIVSDEKHIPSNFTDDNQYVEIYKQNVLNDKKMVELLCKCSIMVIPTFPSEELLGPIGNTSFCDATALGMPCIVASNTLMAENVMKFRLGLVYNVGDLNDLTEKITYCREHPDTLKEMSRNIKKFWRENDSLKFAMVIKNIVDSFY